MRSIPSVLLSASLLAACQFDLSNGVGGAGGVTLDLIGSEGAELNNVVLWVREVEFRSTDGTTVVGIPEQGISLFGGPEGVRLLSNEQLPDGDYDRITLRVISDPVETLSSVETFSGGLFPLDVAGDRVVVNTDFSLRERQARSLVMVLHTQASVLPNGEPPLFFEWRDSGYAVRGDRAGLMRVTVPYTGGCPDSAGADEVAVYVFPQGVEPQDIRGNENDPVVSFALAASDDGTQWEGLSPPLLEGPWRFAFTCRALNDDPDAIDLGVTDDLRDTVTSASVDDGLEAFLSF
ncbi:MAG: hypothetical protein WED00_02730 [Aquisalimonadaceae bacterium]